MRAEWINTSLDEVCEIVNGGTPKTDVDAYWEGTHQWITPAEMGKRDTPYVSASQRKITDTGLKNSSANILPPYSVIISSRAPIGYLVINTSPMAFNQGCKGLVPHKEMLDYKYLYYFLFSNVDYLDSLGTGATFKELSGGKLKKVTIPVPPIPEQKRIVEILDEAFEGIDAAIANTEKIIRDIKEFSSSKKTSLFEKMKATERVVPVPEVCEDIFAGGDAPKDNFSEKRTDKYNIPIIANAVKDNGLYGYTDLSRVIKPSVTVAARGSGTGHTEIRNEPFFPIVRLIVLTPDVEKMNVKFLMYAIQNLEILRSGSAIPQLTVPMIKGYSIPVPSLQKQNQIVGMLDDILSACDMMLANYKNKLNLLNELKQSLLQKAFRGELTSSPDTVAEIAA